MRSTGKPHLTPPTEVTKADSAPFAFAFPDLEGRIVRSDDPRFRGKVLLVDIFGTWCPTCHEAAPVLTELYRTRKSRGLEMVGLAERASARPAELSGGQKQRVAILRALSQGASVLCFDEPTSALDPSLREEVREVLRRVARGEIGNGNSRARRTLVLVTHEAELARELATESFLMKEGKLEPG